MLQTLGLMVKHFFSLEVKITCVTLVPANARCFGLGLEYWYSKELTLIMNKNCFKS